MKTEIKDVKTQSATRMATIVLRRLKKTAKHVGDPRVTTEIKDIQRQVREMETALDKCFKHWDRALIRAEETDRVLYKTFKRLTTIYPLIKGTDTPRDVRKAIKRTLLSQKAHMRAQRSERPLRKRKMVD